MLELYSCLTYPAPWWQLYATPQPPTAVQHSQVLCAIPIRSITTSHHTDLHSNQHDIAAAEAHGERGYLLLRFVCDTDMLGMPPTGKWLESRTTKESEKLGEKSGNGLGVRCYGMEWVYWKSSSFATFCTPWRVWSAGCSGSYEGFEITEIGWNG